MKITKDDVKHVAELARIRFSDEELLKFTEQLGNILEYIEKISELDTKDVEPTYHVLDISTPRREDAVKPLLGSEEALENAPYREEDYFAVPKFIED
ncbi:MAG: Asp-tRNA(Asn)/Glu-tRNA(Gln) amidotransferase subunit GatC [Thermodesulfobacteriota bacterium]